MRSSHQEETVRVASTLSKLHIEHAYPWVGDWRMFRDCRWLNVANAANLHSIMDDDRGGPGQIGKFAYFILGHHRCQPLLVFKPNEGPWRISYWVSTVASPCFNYAFGINGREFHPDLAWLPRRAMSILYAQLLPPMIWTLAAHFSPNCVRSPNCTARTF